MHYSAEQYTQLEGEWKSLSEELPEEWVSLARDVPSLLSQEQAREHIIYGAARRLMIITRCLKNVFKIFPIRRTQLLDDDERNDLEINLHAFLINIHGLPDNLAWAYVLERQISINPFDVGLFQRKTKEHLPLTLREYLESISSWHQDYAKNYRDALAHRIPPYVPPAAWLRSMSWRLRNCMNALNRPCAQVTSIRVLNSTNKSIKSASFIRRFFIHSWTRRRVPLCCSIRN